jgi:hypothetical protein
MAITGIKKRLAVFYDDKGEEVGKKSFSSTAKLITFKGRSFNVFSDCSSFTSMKRWYWDLEIYHYPLDNPNPLVLNKKCEPLMDSEAYNVQLTTKVLKDLNEHGKKGLLSSLTPMQIIIGLVVVVALYFILTGQTGKITGAG